MLPLVFFISAIAGEPATAAADELQQALNVLAQLDAARVSINFSEETLEQALTDLNANLSVTVRADWTTLKRLGVDNDDRITLKLAGSGSAALSALALSLGDEFERPIFEVHAGQMVLTTLQATEAMRLTTLYDVRDLIADAALFDRLRDTTPPADDQPPATHHDEPAPETQPDHDRAPSHWPEAAPPARRHRHNILTDAPPVEQASNQSPESLREPTRGELLINLITDHVDPEAWMNFGGSRAKVTDQNGVLLVTATPTTHRKLSQALRQLREASSNSIRVNAAIVDLPRDRWESLHRQFGQNSAALASAVRDDPAAVALWKSNAPTTVDHPLSIESQSSDIAVHCNLSPHLDAQTRQVTIDVETSTSQTGDRRVVKSTVSFPGDERASTLELPASRPGPTVRLLVLSIERG